MTRAARLAAVLFVGYWLACGLMVLTTPQLARGQSSASQQGATVESNYAVTGTAVTLAAPAGSAKARAFLAIDNESTTDTIACRFDGSAAALNSAGSWTIPAGMTRTWTGAKVPAGTINCISNLSGGGTSTPISVEE